MSLITVYEVKKDEVINCDITGILGAIRNIQKMFGKNACKSLAVFIDGYNSVSEELYEIPEVRAWVQKLFNKMPHVLYYINTDISDHVYLITSLSDDVLAVSYFNKKPIDQFSFEEWQALPKINVNLKLSSDTLHKIINSIIKHGKSVGNKKGALEVANHWSKIFE